MIEKNGVYKIKGNSKYFLEKYGTSNPQFTVEDTDVAVFGRKWYLMSNNPCAICFALRAEDENIDITGTIYYGKVSGLGELVAECELEQVK